MYTEIYDNGKYIGNIQNGKRNGKGIYYWDNGDKYEGDWVNGNKEGKGILYGKMEINKKVNLKIISLQKEKGFIIGLMVINMKEIG